MGIELIEDLGRLFPTATSKQKTRFGLYKCICGKEFKATANSIKSGHTKSCGCLKNKLISDKNSTHGNRNTRLYNIWSNMKQRCYYKKSSSYKRYGALGIAMCDEWLNSFSSFYEWSIDNGYKDNLTIGRIDGTGNYNPENCRWETKKVQARNIKIIRSNNTSGFKGVSFNKRLNKYTARINSGKPIFLGVFKIAEDAAIAYDKYIIDNNLEHSRNFSETK